MDKKGRLVTAEDARRFILAGNAALTLVSLKTGARFTYRVRRPDANEGQVQKDIWFVSLLTGPENTTDYAYMGQLWPPRGYSAFTRERLEYAHGRKSRVNASAPGAQAFAWFTRALFLQGRLPDTVEVWHEGRCARCGRVLTVPASIATGFGPECAGRAGIPMAEDAGPARPRQRKATVKPTAASEALPFNDDIPFGDAPHSNDEGD